MKFKLLFSVAMLASLFFAACKHDSHASKQPVAAADAKNVKYQCPMNCEKGKQYDQPGQCPVCKMDLKAVEVSETPKTYKVAFQSDPAELSAGKAAKLSFIPTIVEKPGEAVPLDVVHEKKIHLIAVSDDLSAFDHIHPEYQPDGSYQINVLDAGAKYTNGPNQSETYFRNGGKYLLFVDYHPASGQPQVEKIELNVGGKAAATKQFTAEKMSATVDGYTFSLEPMAHDGGKAEIVAGQEAHLKGVLKKGGKILDANTLQNYLGAKAHVVVIGVANKKYLHVHPNVVDGVFDLHATFDEPGIYRAWVQFQGEEKTETVDFVLNVKGAVQ